MEYVSAEFSTIQYCTAFTTSRCQCHNATPAPNSTCTFQ